MGRMARATDSSATRFSHFLSLEGHGVLIMFQLIFAFTCLRGIFVCTMCSTTIVDTDRPVPTNFYCAPFSYLRPILCLSPTFPPYTSWSKYGLPAQYTSLLGIQIFRMPCSSYRIVAAKSKQTFHLACFCWGVLHVAPSLL